ncbi:retrotransposon ty1-copia subclass [Plasmopara halstedii]|uniref:Retrotransposon ty1-copia subclass n=1 Tax=Plasmopara halstedii TaxID=4781 RepID=A0A0P1B564_PLAHL|nr:retrotransposon ty1-copia subclass [Plasmopara halstedii]CEG49956.1 retrotransposon ty1-copia subclass [Plasmopara halstedii]|eukprot:XP_024586325.1 retrotransposon ty1-copia subclass [Plasmopara halstedii]
MFGVDYNETFAPVVKHTSIRTLFALAAEKDLEIYQFDVNTAFLYGTIDTDIFMEQPDGYISEKYPDHVCKLKRSLYGTKQAATQWNMRLHDHMMQHGFKRTDADHCVYIRDQGKAYVVIIIYVDDLIVMPKTKKSIDEICKQLKNDFDIKELGEIKYCLGIQGSLRDKTECQTRVKA